ncbi:tripartite tricarboxylate transporter permease [Pollutimonas sp. H1-120]|uniref:tripartite tricarboxylate transporter permease n=1 Tax=Pollutimonas sp. H1-120 TaxID=3148824 RepID=UPI003B52C312
MNPLIDALPIVFQTQTLIVLVLASVFGLLIGAIPGLTATMAMALLVPVTFFLEPIAAVGAMVACSAMAIFAGDVPGTLMRMPGTPASAAYTDEAYAMTRNGQASLALGANVIFSALGGIFGTIVLIFAAPALAEVAIKFSSFEYFWLAMLGITCAAFMAGADPIKGLVSLCFGLLVAMVGINNPAGTPRFTMGNTDLIAGIEFIPAMIGMFAVSEVLRYAMSDHSALAPIQQHIGNIFKSTWTLAKTYWRQQIRGNITGTLIGALPGAGADVAAWVAYAVSKKFSKTPEKFGKGHVEGIIESTSANNAALGGSWIPALVFGIPGDSITAIVIGVLFMKGLNPGPTLFINHPESMYAIFLIFILANLLMIPLGWLLIKAARHILSVPYSALMPLVLLFCIVGGYASTNSNYGVVLMLVFGVIGLCMERYGFPVAPAILAMVLGPLLEQSFITSMIKSDSVLGLVERPIAAALAAVCALIWLLPLLKALRQGLSKDFAPIS